MERAIGVGVLGVVRLGLVEGMSWSLEGMLDLSGVGPEWRRVVRKVRAGARLSLEWIGRLDGFLCSKNCGQDFSKPLTQTPGTVSYTHLTLPKKRIV